MTVRFYACMALALAVVGILYLAMPPSDLRFALMVCVMAVSTVAAMIWDGKRREASYRSDAHRHSE
jgi:hypothetical protein